MDAIECITGRKSVRKFRPDPVPRETITAIIEAARFAPSYRNSQPWDVTIVSGAKKEALAELLVGLIEADTPIRPDIPTPASWPLPLQERMKESIQRRAAALGQDLKDPAMPKRSKIMNSRFYGAPHGIFFHQDASLSQWSVMDIGAFTQTVMLAAYARGIGTVPQAFLTDYAADVKKFLGIPESGRLMLGMSLGYPDLSSPAATYRSERREAADIIRWVE